MVRYNISNILVFWCLLGLVSLSFPRSAEAIGWQEVEDCFYEWFDYFDGPSARNAIEAYDFDDLVDSLAGKVREFEEEYIGGTYGTMSQGQFGEFREKLTRDYFSNKDLGAVDDVFSGRSFEELKRVSTEQWDEIMDILEDLSSGASKDDLIEEIKLLSQEQIDVLYALVQGGR